MTGREQKVYYSYSQISHKHNIPGESTPQGQKEDKPQGFILPELEHNLQLLIDMTEQEIIQNDRQLQYEKDMVVNLSHELEKLTEVLGREETTIHNLSQVLQTVEECELRMQPQCKDPLTLEECAHVFETLQDKYYEEYKMSEQADLAVAIVYPLMKEYFKDWDPLRDPTYGIDVLTRWKNLLEEGHLSHSAQDAAMDPYHRLLWEMWLPFLRTIISQWQPRNCAPMVDFLDCWVHLVPIWILDNILDQLIFPKLQKEVRFFLDTSVLL
ncbi:hypothetical protein FKM82_024159 [Ascaphus truei]